jgi:hypothetical protein
VELKEARDAVTVPKTRRQDMMLIAVDAANVPKGVTP